jgi:hypothetical protein
MKAFVQSDSCEDRKPLGSIAAAAVDRRILISIPNGFHLRQFVHSGVLDLLLSYGFKALIVSPMWEREASGAQVSRERVLVQTLDIKQGPLLRRYLAARQHLLVAKQPTATLRYKMVDLRRRLPSAALAAQVANGLFRVFPRLRQQALRWERLILSDKAIDELLSTEAVDVVLLGSPGYTPLDAFLLHAGVSRGIPVVVAMLSWDNLSSKGGINPVPDALLVSSAHMRLEAINLHGIPPERIIETGAPLYDAFANSARFGSRAENLRALGLDPGRRLIVYGTNHAGFFPDEIEIVKRVAQAVEEDAFGEPCQLWIRLHPQAVNGPYAVPMEPYSRLASRRVKVEFPPVRDSKLPWDLPRDDLQHLIRLLRDADVVINTASSLSIDAAVLDRPTICIAFDPAGDLPYEKSVRRYYDYTHMANVVRLGAAQVATSFENLQRKIADYLRSPDLDGKGRQLIIEQQLGRVDGESANRVAEAVLNMLPGRSRSEVAKTRTQERTTDTEVIRNG